MVTPIDGGYVSAAYGISGDWSLGWHTGIDYATSYGSRVMSCTPGTVTHIGWQGTSLGYTVAVRWENVELHYCHMIEGSAGHLSGGQQVSAGQQIGQIGLTGRTSGPHVHLEMRVAPYTWAAANFRNPQPAIDYDPQEEEMNATQDRQLREIHRLLGAGGALDAIGTNESHKTVAYRLHEVHRILGARGALDVIDAVTGSAKTVAYKVNDIQAALTNALPRLLAHAEGNNAEEG